MSWVCEYCSSANDESQRECFVCGNSRSAASIRAAKRERRAERATCVGRRVWRGINIGGRVLFYASIALLTVMAGVIIATKINDRALDDLSDVAATMLAHIGANLKCTFGDHAGGNSVSMVFSELFSGRSGKYAALGTRFSGVGDSAGSALRSLGQTASLIGTQFAEQVDVVIDRFGRLFSGIREKI